MTAHATGTPLLIRAIRMRPLTWVACVFAIGALSTQTAAQSRPNFSGQWTVAPPPAAPTTGARGRGSVRAGDLGSGWGPSITITQTPSSVTVEYEFFARGDLQPPLKFVFALDGSETVNTILMGRGVQQEKARVAWENNALLVTTRQTFPNLVKGQNVTVEVKRRLSLESPTSLVVETTREGVLGGPTTSTRTVYTKG